LVNKLILVLIICFPFLAGADVYTYNNGRSEYPDYFYLLCKKNSCTNVFATWFKRGIEGVTDVASLNSEQINGFKEIAKLKSLSLLDGVYEFETIGYCLDAISYDTDITWDSKELRFKSPTRRREWLRKVGRASQYEHHLKQCKKYLSVEKVGEPSLEALQSLQKKWKDTPDKLFRMGIGAF
jgi:hypothetical protein